ncbi:MHC class I polypeptide-related sequence B-like isoform X3 [Sciurus carolinensis]|uniref:MHC class I polypeptide-related sequence B-like isoform X3 n=1 Tax=Sciurus carolinensis TaxID=30640 RepID=UPI001FB25C07|nr:MHC class I polypeptide-related sequence B-like isoform X3 [Sciurus carolinensis]
MTNSLALELTHTMLLLAGAVGAAVGAHSLHYNLTVRSQGGSVQSRSFAEGYWDHQLFLQYDSDNQGSAEPWGPWAEKPLGTENWNTEMQDLAEHIKKLKMTLADINAWQEQKGGTGLLLQSRRPACLCVAAGGVAVIMIIVCVLWCKKRKTTSATEDFGEKSGCENTSPSSALEVTK